MAKAMDVRHEEEGDDQNSGHHRLGWQKWRANIGWNHWISWTSKKSTNTQLPFQDFAQHPKDPLKKERVNCWKARYPPNLGVVKWNEIVCPVNSTSKTHLRQISYFRIHETSRVENDTHFRIHETSHGKGGKWRTRVLLYPASWATKTGQSWYCSFSPMYIRWMDFMTGRKLS